MLLFTALILAATGGTLPSGRGPDPQPFAITGATVITMTSKEPLRNATVVVRGGRIAAVGPAASTPVPADARRIDGRGMYLMPGLTDMHAHLFSDEYAPHSAAPAELGLYLALGTTSARIQIGRPQHLELQRACARGRCRVPGSGCRRRSSRATRERTRCWCATPPRRARRCGRRTRRGTTSSSSPPTSRPRCSRPSWRKRRPWECG